MKKLPLLLVSAALLGTMLTSCGDTPSSSESTVSSSAVSDKLTVRFVNYDGTLLQEGVVSFGGSLPQYEGETPHRDTDASYYYAFDGWDEKYIDVNVLQYKARFKEIDYTISDNFVWAFNEEQTEVILYGFYDDFRAFENVYVPDVIYYQGVSYPVTEIYDFAISSHYAKKVYLGRNVRTVAPLFISNYASHSVGYIEVDPANENLASMDGVLYTKDMTHLIKVPLALQMETYLLPDSVTTIDQMALQDVEVIRNFETRDTSNLKTIGMQAFSGASIQNVHLPEGLKTIGLRAFWLNNSIQTLTIPGTVEFDEEDDDCCLQFASMDSLNTITFSEGITSIPWQACSGSTTLSKVILPSTLKTVVDYAFFGCTSITSITLPAGLEDIRSSAFSDTRIAAVYTSGKETNSSFTLPDGITEIKNWAFSSCALSGTININAAITKIGEYSFYGNNYITAFNVDVDNVTYSSIDGVLFTKDAKKIIRLPNGRYGKYEVPDGVETISSGFLTSNTSISKITLPSSIRSIESNAFGSSNISSINLPAGLVSIGDNAFSYTRCLESISFPSSLTSIGEWAFSGSGIEEVTSWGGLTSLPKYCFYNADNLQSVDLRGSSIASIGETCFASMTGGLKEFIGGENQTNLEWVLSSCGNLESVDLGACSNLTTLPSYAFGYGGNALNNAVIPSSVTKMEHDTLATFKSLKEIKYTGTKEQWNTLVGNSLLTNEEIIEHQDWNEWYGANLSTLTSIVVNYGSASETKYTVDLREDNGIIAE